MESRRAAINASTGMFDWEELDREDPSLSDVVRARCELKRYSGGGVRPVRKETQRSRVPLHKFSRRPHAPFFLPQRSLWVRPGRCQVETVTASASGTFDWPALEEAEFRAQRNNACDDDNNDYNNNNNNDINCNKDHANNVHSEPTVSHASNDDGNDFYGAGSCSSIAPRAGPTWQPQQRQPCEGVPLLEVTPQPRQPLRPPVFEGPLACAEGPLACAELARPKGPTEGGDAIVDFAVDDAYVSDEHPLSADSDSDLPPLADASDSD